MQTLADKFQVTVTDVEKKIHQLRTQFRREYNKELEAERRGSPKAPSWYGYEAMKFLVPAMKFKQNESDGGATETYNSDDFVSK